MKRGFDLTFSGLVLLVTMPILLLIAVGICLSSPGPVFYRARRVGLDGKDFEMLKFRSMHIGSGGSVITVRGDRRIFRFGRLVRKLKLDELPQFLNVLKGDMSIVGPRPEDPKIVAEHYTDWMRETLRVRPGITSPGAILYYTWGENLVDPQRPEESYAERLLPIKLAVERAYIERATFLSDIEVMIVTTIAILRHMAGRPGRPYAKDFGEASRWIPVTLFKDIR